MSVSCPNCGKELQDISSFHRNQVKIFRCINEECEEIPNFYDEKSMCNSVVTLHALGDKRVLTLKRGDAQNFRFKYTWILSDVFKSYYYGGANVQQA